jgi:hypothetical protein
LWFLQLTVSLAFFTCFSSVSHAVAWSDNFNDGSITDNNPVAWITNLGSPDHDPASFFPSTYDASSGDLVLNPDDPSPFGQSSAFVPVGFADTYIRTQGIVIPDPADPINNNGGNLVVTARIDPNTLSGYLAYFDVSGNLNIQILAGGSTADIGVTFDAPFNAGSEAVLELNIIGDQLSAYAWAADDPNGKPATPQATATDATFTSGIAGIAFAEDDPFTSGVYRYVSAQSTPFVDPLPGDYNNNGKVDAADYVVWRNGDSPFDGQSGYDAWAAHFGNGAGSGSGLSAVPEPAGLVLLLTAIIASVTTAGRRRLS